MSADRIITNSTTQTKKMGKKLAQTLKDNEILILVGELGSGKTTFVKGLAKGLGVDANITSPTFVLVKSYKLKTKSYDKIYHIDCYRLTPEELAALNFQEIINNPQNIILIEWAEKIKKILPKKNAIWLKFDYGEKENERNITLR